MYSGMGEAFKGMWIAIITAICITTPLGLWKLWEIGIWLKNHLHVTWK